MTHFTVYSARSLKITRHIKPGVERLNIQALTTTGELIEFDIFANDPTENTCIISAHIEEAPNGK
jgi:hypothetical protein